MPLSFATNPPLAIRALRHRNFRLFFFGQSISLVGTWIQQLAMSWLIYRLTHSALMLGWIGFLGQVPAFFLAPIAGVLADRWNRHRIVIWTQVLSMAQALLLAALVLTDRVEVWHIVVLATFLGSVNGFDIPVRQSFLSQMVESRDDLANAIALNSSMFNGARLVGPAIAGVAIGLIGEGMCFLLNGLSYIAVLGALFAMRVAPRPAPAGTLQIFHPLVEGFRYAARSGPIKAVLLLVSLASLVGVPYTVLMPIFATRILHGDARTLGFLMAATGLGALAGALFLASRPTVRGLGRIIVIAAALFGTGLIAFALSKSLALSMTMLLVTGFGMMVQMASSNTILQTVVEEDKRGRVMSFYTMAYIGSAPIGSLGAGAVANHFGAPITIAAGGVICLFGALGFALNLPQFRTQVRPIYTRLGIPEITSGIDSYTQLTVPPEKQ